jgi:hypothetical protein
MDVLRNDGGVYRGEVFGTTFEKVNQCYNEFDFNECLFENGLVFKQCLVKDDFRLENCNLGCGVYFDDCTFEKNVWIKQCTTNKELNETVQGKSGFSLTFENCKIRGSLVISGEVVKVKDNAKIVSAVSPTFLQRGLFIENTEVDGRIYFGQIHISLNGLIIKKTTVRNGIDVENLTNAGVLFGFDESTVDGLVKIDALADSGSADYSFHKTTFKSMVYLNNVKSKSSILFNYGCYLGDFNITVFKCEKLSIHDADFKKHLEVSFLNNTGELKMGAEVIYVKNSQFAESLRVLGSKKGNKTKCPVEKITVVSTKVQKGDMVFDKFMADEIFLEGTNYENNIQFRNIETKKLNVQNFTNFATVIFQNFKSNSAVDSEFHIENSNLGNTSFINCKLKSFAVVNIIDSLLNKMSISNVEWFESKKVNEQNEPKDQDYWAKKREVFKQLKDCLEENKDRIHALDFKSYEMKAYQKELRNSQGRYADKVLLVLNWLSNNHGLSWAKGVWFTLGCWLISCLLFVMVRDGIAFPWDDDCLFLPSNLAFWKEAIGFLWLPEGLDGLVKSNNALFDTSSGWGRLVIGTFLFLLGKVAVAYGIFQTISAFRKYGKS